GALSLTSIPDSIAVVGGGYIGLELGTAFAKLGSQVMVIEAAHSILPHYDADLTRPVQKHLTELGIEVLSGTRVNQVQGNQVEILRADGETQTVTADKVLVTVGRQPNTQSCGVNELQLTMNGPFIEIDNRCQSSMRGVYAIGDVTGEPMLAHRAMAQGEMVAEIIAGRQISWDKQCIPAVCFTDPEIVTVGLSPAEALAEDHEISVGQFPLQANGRAMTMESDSGFVRVVASKHDGVLLGVQAVGQGVSELSAAFALAIEMGACAEDIQSTVHAHPTLSESFAEACMQVTGSALHI
ncbi:MAG: FAD-dependent oxidoreductase, partial [Pseudomonadota bacterium]